MKNPRELQTIANILGGVPILGVLPGSAADRAGLRYGDIVTRVNGIPTTNFNEFLSAHDRSTSALSLEIFRNGEKLCFEMALPVRHKHEDRDSSSSMRTRVARRVAADAVANQKLS
jgi:S1-C subfamily serine protease